MVGSRNKPTLKLLLLSSMMAVSLMLSACQKEAASSENDTLEGAEAGEMTDLAVSEGLVSSMSPTSDESEPVELTAQDKLTTTLSHHRWTLVNAVDANEQPMAEFANINSQVTLAFNQYQGQDTLSYSVGCNTISAGYQLKGHTLTTEEGMSTKMSCGELDLAENILNTLMQGSSEFKIDQGDNPVLTQFTDDDVTLVWNGRLTAQAKYNSKGETVFWAVNSETVPCEAGNSEQCLQVKPITYNDQGIKTHEGQWRVFVGEIDGYQHDSKHEEVLRLQRYPLNIDELSETNEPTKDDTADEKYAYILDAVIESLVVE
ncbi:META domain-containing protein [Psychrobacter sp. Pi2-52]|uniref:META domain-containing protein n=1 Tax=Psychrobacter sp. Pi2-52 TaxID=2774133 RepID=UPI001918CAA5|nr:META domain-containing protein [Psychrobacter sp. Pi2-52]